MKLKQLSVVPVLIVSLSGNLKAQELIRTGASSVANDVSTCIERKPLQEFGATHEGAHYTAYSTGDVSVVDLATGDSEFLSHGSDKQKALDRLEEACLEEEKKNS